MKNVAAKACASACGAWFGVVAEIELTALERSMQLATLEDVNRIISELVTMLRPDYGWQADVLIRLREAANGHDIQAAQELFASRDLWGGAGSVCDVSFFNSASNARKCELEIELVDAFASAGITNKAASEMAAIYRRWIAEDVFCRPKA